MPWTYANYPNSMKNFYERTRNKAIDIANTLLEEGYDEGRAIPIAISQAKKWAGASNDAPGPMDLHVVPHPEGWAVRREHAERASVVMETKEEARHRAFEMAKHDGVDVILHDEDGRIESYADVDVLQEQEI